LEKVGEGGGGSAETPAQIAALEGSSWSQLLQHSTKIADAHGHQLRNVCSSGLSRAGLGELHNKAGHRMREPKLPRFCVVGGHAHALLGPGVELIKEVSIH